ncbi:translation machinery-associated protein 16 [Limtongia smithiae]|uniref:translation machinery-associated protein 16 n=1 Tax=Limtongia smithiae TaxID=1125753 RepID=UPI0034CDDA9B
MPVAKSLRKVEQKLKKKDAVHPKARKFKQLNRATLRERKVVKGKMDRGVVRESQIIRFKFLRACVDKPENADKLVFTEEEIQQMILEFISRDDAELKQLQAARRPGRPSSSRQDALQTRRGFEMDEFDAGFYTPDLMNKDIVKAFRDWNQEHSGIGLLKFVRIAREGGLQIPQTDRDEEGMAQ